MRVVGCSSDSTVNDVRPSLPSVTPVLLTETRKETVSDRPMEKSTASDT